MPPIDGFFLAIRGGRRSGGFVQLHHGCVLRADVSLLRKSSRKIRQFLGRIHIKTETILRHRAMIQQGGTRRSVRMHQDGTEVGLLEDKKLQ